MKHRIIDYHPLRDKIDHAQYHVKTAVDQYAITPKKWRSGRDEEKYSIANHAAQAGEQCIQIANQLAPLVGESGHVGKGKPSTDKLYALGILSEDITGPFSTLVDDRNMFIHDLEELDYDEAKLFLEERYRLIYLFLYEVLKFVNESKNHPIETDY